MGRLIVSAQMTLDAVMDQVEGWFDSQGESEDHGVEELRAADALVLGQDTYEHFSAHWPSRFWMHPVVWGDGVRPFHAGSLPMRMRLIAVTSYASGVVKCAYQPLGQSS